MMPLVGDRSPRPCLLPALCCVVGRFPVTVGKAEITHSALSAELSHQSSPASMPLHRKTGRWQELSSAACAPSLAHGEVEALRKNMTCCTPTGRVNTKLQGHLVSQTQLLAVDSGLQSNAFQTPPGFTVNARISKGRALPLPGCR